MSEKVSNWEVAREAGKLLAEIGMTIGKFLAVLAYIFLALGISATLAVFIGPHLLEADTVAIGLLDLVPDIVWTVARLILSLISLAWILALVWAFWETARERASDKEDNPE